MQIRHADPDRDAAACLEIYAPFVTGSAVSFEHTAPSEPEFAERMRSYGESYPWLVAQDGDRVAGFAYAGAHRARAAYRWACETSVYIHPDYRRQGLGRRLYDALMPLLTRQGLTLAIAGITLPNPGSVALHESIGFRPVGVYARVGFKAGAWRDVGWYQLPLADPGDGVPPDPGPPARLDP